MRKKVTIGILIIVVIIVVVSVIAIPRIIEHNNLIKVINSLQYEAIEADGIKYYPVPEPVMAVPYSLPPHGSQIVYRVVDGETDYSHEYFARLFIDDYDKDCLYFDGLVFEKQGVNVMSLF